MKLKYAILNTSATCGDIYMLTEVSPVYSYVDGKRTGDPIAYNYTVVLPQRKFDQLRVRIEGGCKVSDLEEPVQVDLTNLILEIRWSQSEGHYIAGAASDIVLMDET